MQKKHERTLKAIFAKRAPTDLTWREVDALLNALGSDVSERAGSRVCAELNGAVIVVHKPHPQPELKRSAVRSIAAFLRTAGIKP
jgi:hypothetical protein